MSTPPRPVLVDTCVLLDDPGVILRIRHKHGIPILSGTVLDEIDHHKKGNALINSNARAIFRELNKVPGANVKNFATGQDLLPGDILTRFVYKGEGVFVLGRSTFKSRSNNDGTIIEIARDYQMLLLTRDAGMKLRAQSLGVTAIMWTGPLPAPAAAAPVALAPFALPSSPLLEQDQATPVRYLPKEGDTVCLGSGGRIQLGKLVSEGGEGSIYLAANDGMVCKIYHADKLTLLRRKKIELMLTRQVERAGICWPTDLVLNETGQFLGYLMPRALGSTVQSSLFVKPLLEKKFPQWRRGDLVNLCVAFLEHIRFLHGLNILVGDINPLNLLVTADSTQLWLVDTDSFQVENFACPVGTVNFTAPEIQGCNYPEFLRTKEHELFAVATMLFMLLHPGKSPYSQQGGGSPADNIRAMDFPYWFRKDGDDFGGKNTPHGPWQYIWGNLPYTVKEAFHNTFRSGKRASVEEWLRACKKYQTMLSNGHTSDALFATGFHVRDPHDVTCARCGTQFVASKEWVDKLTGNGWPVRCGDCVQRLKLERLAKQSLRDAESAAHSRVPVEPPKRVPASPAHPVNPALPTRPIHKHAPAGAARGPAAPAAAPGKPPASTGNTILDSIVNFFLK
ncbi:PIN domain-containing protein [Massilia genomosp. 1]|uniref:Protein kinase domain-containing protein n=1 Tax=Massilia genomosp. 1 TaxID=2609280 RepID=A0ABX0N0F8_9BURK|nr:hypothetical protein [Massilia genomosp. 1]